RNPIISAASFFAVNNVLCSTIFYIVSTGNFTKYDFVIGTTYFSAMPMENLQGVQSYTLSFFLFLNILGVLSCIRLVRSQGFHDSPQLRGTQYELATDALGRLGNHPAVSIFFGMMLVLCIYHYVSMDTDILWLNH